MIHFMEIMIASLLINILASFVNDAKERPMQCTLVPFTDIFLISISVLKSNNKSLLWYFNLLVTEGYF